LIKELVIDNSLGKPTYTPITLTKGGFLDSHRSVLKKIPLILPQKFFETDITKMLIFDMFGGRVFNRQSE
jgi:hypothetical protein